MPDTPRARADELDAAIDALYQGPLGGFTASRNALAAERRTAGDRAGADRVKALAKPTATAWGVNQVWWRNRAVMERLLAAGERQRAAHRAFAEGGASDVRAAAVERQQAVDAVVERAVDALGGMGSVTPDLRHRLAGTVEALASGGVPADVEPGRLTRDLQPSGLEAFGALAGLAAATPNALPRPRPTLVPAPQNTSAAGAKAANATPAGARAAGAKEAGAAARTRAAEAAEKEARAREAHEKKIEETRARLTGLEAALEAATREATELASEERRARTELDAAAARVANLENELEQAREAERASRRTLSSATKAASEAEMMRARTARDVGSARKQLDDLQSA